LLLTLPRYLDLLVLALALPVFALSGAPLLGYAGVALAWVCQRWIVAVAKRRALATGDRGAVMRAVGWSMIVRLALVTSSVVVVGVVDRAAGLSAALLAAALFTVALAAQLALPSPAGTRR
jgi:hypothetical protein